MEVVQFKFKWVDAQGKEPGLFSKKGMLSGDSLTLDGQELPANTLVGNEQWGNRFALIEPGQDGEAEHRTIAVTEGADNLRPALNRAHSKQEAHRRREQLQKQGRGGAYHEAECPHCHATLDLTDFPRTPQVYCWFCNTITTIDSPDGVPRAESAYRLCEECGMYSKPRRFTIFYFYFLLVIYGFSSRETWRCPACMRPEAWKMLFGNLLFVLGVPVALVQLFRSYGGTDIGSLYGGLDAANLKARKGNLEGAIQQYRKILENHEAAVGVKYNIGMAFLHKNDRENAARTLEYALEDCSNFRPAAVVLANCYEATGETAQLEALKQLWSEEEQAAHEAESQAEAG